MKQTQKQKVIGLLLKNGLVRRNECLAMYISRLGAIICDLEREGWEFEARYSKDGKDYGYITKKCPLKKETYTLPNGETITKYAK
jgi:hypothetical protein